MGKMLNEVSKPITYNVEALAKGDVLLPKDDRNKQLGFNFLAAELTIIIKTKCMKEYRKTATVKAKLFEKGDEDGFIHRDGMIGAMEDAKYGITPDLVPYISTLENQFHRGQFGKHYLCVGVNNERWLVDRDIFERTYTEVK